MCQYLAVVANAEAPITGTPLTWLTNSYLEISPKNLRSKWNKSAQFSNLDCACAQAHEQTRTVRILKRVLGGPAASRTAGPRTPPGRPRAARGRSRASQGSQRLRSRCTPPASTLGACTGHARLAHGRPTSCRGRRAGVRAGAHIPSHYGAARAALGGGLPTTIS